MLNKGLPGAISLHHYPFASSLSCVGVVIVVAKGVGLLVLLMIVVAGIFVVLMLWWSSCRGSLVVK